MRTVRSLHLLFIVGLFVGLALPAPIARNPHAIERLQLEALARVNAATRLKRSHDALLPFACKPDEFSPRNATATSVNELTVRDIDIVMAMGDSITAGFGAGSDFFTDLVEDYRGLSFSIGGDDDVSEVITVPNVIKEYNADLRGYSRGEGDDRRGLNAAESGNKVQDMPDQAQFLIDRLAGIENADEQWKVLFILIGHNNLCDYCEDPTENGAARYKEILAGVLDTLKASVPRLFVNILPPFDVTQLKRLREDHPIRCAPIQEIGEVCECVTDGSEQDLEEIDDERALYIQAIRELAADPAYEAQDFTVEYQPFTTAIDVPVDTDDDEEEEVDLDYFAPDCFHFSQKGHEAAAVGLWNNMWEPPDNKTVSFDPEDPMPIFCPAEDAVLCTAQNADHCRKEQPGIDYDDHDAAAGPLAKQSCTVPAMLARLFEELWVQGSE